MARNRQTAWRVEGDTVRKYATMEDRSPKPAAGKGRRSLIDAYPGTVDSWLSADRLMPRKQRHAARRVYARLVEGRASRARTRRCGAT